MDMMTQRTLGEHEAEIAALQRDMLELKGDVKKILEVLAEARGGWKVVLAGSAMIGAISSAASWIAFHWWTK